MILLWFTLGILLAFGIARYNESNKLFWQLVLAFVLGYAATVMVDRTVNEDERGNVNLVQVCPTQTSVDVQTAYLPLFNTSNMTSVKVTALKSVIQDYIPDVCKGCTTSSKVLGRTRDQPIKIDTMPPECLVKSSLTLHEYG